MYDIFIGLSLLVLLISRKTIPLVYKFCKYHVLRVLLYYTIWIIISGAILVIYGKFSLVTYLSSIFLLFIFNNLSWYIYPLLISPRFFSLKFLIKIIIVAIYLICSYGLIEYFLHNILHLNILEPVQHILAGRRYYLIDNFQPVDSRLYSVFEEPGYLGGFICINLPIIFNVIFSKYKILKNNILNMILKKSYIPIIFLTTIALKSPIWLLLIILTTVIYFKKKILKYIPIVVITSMMLLSLLCLPLQKFNLSSTFINRIFIVSKNLRNFSNLVTEEASLATRLTCYAVRFSIFLKYPFTGIGYRNIETSTYYDTFIGIDIPLTQEIHKNIIYNKSFKNISGAIFWNALSDTGLIGTILFYLFLVLSIKKINIISRMIQNSLQKQFMLGVKNSYIMIILLSIYDIRSNIAYLWFLLGLTLSFIQYYNLYYKRYNRICTNIGVSIESN